MVGENVHAGRIEEIHVSRSEGQIEAVKPSQYYSEGLSSFGHLPFSQALNNRRTICCGNGFRAYGS